MCYVLLLTWCRYCRKCGGGRRGWGWLLGDTESPRASEGDVWGQVFTCVLNLQRKSMAELPSQVLWNSVQNHHDGRWKDEFSKPAAKFQSKTANAKLFLALQIFLGKWERIWAILSSGKTVTVKGSTAKAKRDPLLRKYVSQCNHPFKILKPWSYVQIMNSVIARCNIA